MPVELLQVTPVYVIVGAYRLLHDGKLRDPIWVACRGAASRGVIVATVWSFFSWPVTSFWVRHFAKRASLVKFDDESRFLGVNVMTYATLSFLFGQASMILEFFLSRQLRKARADAYEATVKSRGKDASFWGPYIEEWSVPPTERAQRAAQKQAWYARLSTPIIRTLVVKILLMPLSFVPFLGMVVSAALRSLLMARILHEPYFKAKQMTPFQRELFVTERLTEYRAFGFTAALLERLPIVGLCFSISNRIGAAMWAHDLEKLQHAVQSGSVPRTKVYASRTKAFAEQVERDPVPQDHGSGAFPTTRTPLSQPPVSRNEIREAAAGGTGLELPGAEGRDLTRRRAPGSNEL